MEKKTPAFLAGTDWKTVGILSGLFIFAFIFWNTPLLYPVKIFVVVLHEFSHGLMAVLTGGKISHITISPLIGGACYFKGGNHFLTASAGYLGSMFWGALILIIASRTKYDNILGMATGAFLVILSILYIRTLFGFFFVLAFGIILFAISYKLSNHIADIMMKFLGMTSCLYAVIDIKDDLIANTIKGSDSYAIAESIGIPALSVPIGIIWIIIAFSVFLVCLYISSKGETGKKEDIKD